MRSLVFGSPPLCTMHTWLPVGRGSPVQISDQRPTPITPEGWTFSIWGLIFVGQAAALIYLLIRRSTSDTVRRSTVCSPAGSPVDRNASQLPPLCNLTASLPAIRAHALKRRCYMLSDTPADCSHACSANTTGHSCSSHDAICAALHAAFLHAASILHVLCCA